MALEQNPEENEGAAWLYTGVRKFFLRRYSMVLERLSRRGTYRKLSAARAANTCMAVQVHKMIDRLSFKVLSISFFTA